jgi:hypothetical protein
MCTGDNDFTAHLTTRLACDNLETLANLRGGCPYSSSFVGKTRTRGVQSSTRAEGYGFVSRLG